MAVVFSHVLMLLPQVGGGAPLNSTLLEILHLPPFRALWGGSEAVVLFFVLSGFVLSLPFYKGPVCTSSFLIKRILRIYPAYFVAVLISLFAYFWLSPVVVEGYSDWFNAVWPESMSVGTFIGHLAMLGSFDNDALNPVLWTLVMEMRIAILFPLIMWMILKLDWRYCLLVAFIVYVFGRGLHWYTNEKIGFSNDYFLTLMFVYQFIAGALLARHYRSICEFLVKLKTSRQWALFVLAVALLQYSAFLPLAYQSTVQRIFNQFPITLGVCILIAMACSHGQMRQLLRGPMLQFLGTISYSLYLIHGIVLVSYVHLFSDKLGLWLIALFAIFSSIIFAWLLYLFVEKPTMQFSYKRLPMSKQFVEQ